MSVLSDIRDRLSGVLRVRPATNPTFAVDIGVAAGGAGYAAELRGVEGKRLRVKSVWFSKPSAQVTLRLIKALSKTTDGTSTGGTVVRLGVGEGSQARVLLFTAAPTAGVAIGDVFEMVVATTDNVEVTFGDNDTEPLEIGGSEALGVNVSAAATIVGRIVFEEVA